MGLFQNETIEGKIYFSKREGDYKWHECELRIPGPLLRLNYNSLTTTKVTQAQCNLLRAQHCC